jgi:hypothetical protein
MSNEIHPSRNWPPPAAPPNGSNELHFIGSAAPRRLWRGFDTQIAVKFGPLTSQRRPATFTRSVGLLLCRARASCARARCRHGIAALQVAGSSISDAVRRQLLLLFCPSSVNGVRACVGVCVCSCVALGVCVDMYSVVCCLLLNSVICIVGRGGGRGEGRMVGNI